MVSKEILKQYIELKKEADEIEERIQKKRDRIEELEGMVVADSVKGTRKDGTYGSIRIEGRPDGLIQAERAMLVHTQTILEKKKHQIILTAQEVEEFINSIDDCHIRRILSFRFIDGLSWNMVAARMGGNNSEDSVRMSFNRFMEKC